MAIGIIQLPLAIKNDQVILARLHSATEQGARRSQHRDSARQGRAEY